ncbi:MAG: TIR domain-containing protein [Oscillospiraceae bacterium]|nr:TIR domain-containing protein [Oscillospiraceae bacterium]
MKVFISWSGDLSNRFAAKLASWIRCVIQNVEVFYSPEDIEKGENWSKKLSDELAGSNFGIVCLTPHNVTAPWIHFEAGALAKALDSRPATLMIGVKDSDVKGPLSQFQNTKLEKDDIFRLMQAINSRTEKPLSPDVLSHTFNTFWPELERHIKETLKSGFDTEPPEQHNEEPNAEAIEEILRIVRKLGGKSETKDQKVIAFPPKNIYNGFISLSKLKEIREEKGLSLSQLEYMCDLPFVFLKCVEEGTHSILFHEADRIANALGVSVEDLIGFNIADQKKGADPHALHPSNPGLPHRKPPAKQQSLVHGAQARLHRACP